MTSYSFITSKPPQIYGVPGGFDALSVILRPDFHLHSFFVNLEIFPQCVVLESELAIFNPDMVQGKSNGPANEGRRVQNDFLYVVRLHVHQVKGYRIPGDTFRNGIGGSLKNTGILLSANGLLAVAAKKCKKIYRL